MCKYLIQTNIRELIPANDKVDCFSENKVILIIYNLIPLWFRKHYRIHCHIIHRKYKYR